MSGRFNLNEYVTVDERIDRFWADYPHGAIRTEMVYTNNDGSSVAIKAAVFKDWEHPQPDATGIAQEERGGANANKSSWWENCETSAIGRALANMGMSISKHRPSREEMEKVERGERAPVARSDAPGRAEPPAAGTAPASPSVVPGGKVANWPPGELLAYANNEANNVVRRKAAFGHYLGRMTTEFAVLQATERMKALHPDDVAELRDRALAALRQPATA